MALKSARSKSYTFAIESRPAFLNFFSSGECSKPKC